MRDVADPFVLKYRGEYYLYRTQVRDGLDVMTSRDLVHWRPGPIVWRPDSPQNARNLWAPEVYDQNGKFYLYFAAEGAEDAQRLWVATADTPLGPFHTQPGGALTPPWRIDPTLFQDEAGGWYLYCCHHPASGGARVEGCRVAGPGAPPAGEWQPMLLPRAPWEGIWVEAPTLLQDRFGYYLLYSGPDAESPNYQIGYATAASPLGPWHKQGILVPTTPAVPGPGHQCVVLAPDNLTPYLLYHRKRLAERGWNRDLMLDRLWMHGGRLATRAPTTTPQPLPPRPAFEAYFDRPTALHAWSPTAGDWTVDAPARELRQRDPLRPARSRLTAAPLRDGVIEVNLRRLAGDGAFGIALVSGAARLPVTLYAAGRPALALGSAPARPLPAGFDPRVYHQLLLTRRGRSVAARLDGQPAGSAVWDGAGAALELDTERAAAAFSAVAITRYTEPLPLGPPEAPATGWQRQWDGRIEQHALGLARQTYPLAARLRGDGRVSVRVRGWALGTSLPVRKYGLELTTADGAGTIEAYIDPANGVLATHGRAADQVLPWQNSDLPLRFDYTTPHRIELARHGAQWRITVDGGSAQTRPAALPGPLRPALVTEDARAEFSDVLVRRAGAEGSRERGRPARQSVRAGRPRSQEISSERPARAAAR